MDPERAANAPGEQQVEDAMENAADAPRSRRRWWIWPLGLLVFLVVGHTVWTLVWRHRYESRIDAMRANGVMVDLTDHASKPVPDAQNAAIPFAQAAAWYEEHLQGDAAITDYVGAWEDTNTDPEDEHYREELARLRRWLASGDRYVELLGETARRPGWYEELAWETGMGMEVLAIPRMARAIDFLSERVRRAERWTPQVTSELLVMVRLSDRVELPILIGRLVSWTMKRRAADTLIAASGLPGFDASRVWEAVQADFVPGPVADQLRRVWAEERAIGIWCTRELIEGWDLLSFLDQLAIPDGPPRERREWWSWPYRALLYSDGVRFLDLIDRAEELTPLAAHEASARADALAEEAALKHGRLISALWSVVPVKGFEARQRYVATMRVARVGLALLVLHERTGAWPQELDPALELVDADDLIDPYTGKRLLWEPGVRLAADRPIDGWTLEEARRFGDLVEWLFEGSESGR
ncbi:MAG: hypothetical protein AAGD14_09905 [Planctomycetota bacterium]